MVNRIARATGHLKMVRDMVEQERDCSEVLIQLAAVKSAVNGAGKGNFKAVYGRVRGPGASAAGQRRAGKAEEGN